MLLTITNKTTPAGELGYLLHKHPARCQTFSLAFGQAHVFYPEAADTRCSASLLLDVDPIGMVRNRRGLSGQRHTLDQYVNDRPYVASSFLCRYNVDQRGATPLSVRTPVSRRLAARFSGRRGYRSFSRTAMKIGRNDSCVHIARVGSFSRQVQRAAVLGEFEGPDLHGHCRQAG